MRKLAEAGKKIDELTEEFCVISYEEKLESRSAGTADSEEVSIEDSESYNEIEVVIQNLVWKEAKSLIIQRLGESCVKMMCYYFDQGRQKKMKKHYKMKIGNCAAALELKIRNLQKRPREQRQL